MIHILYGILFGILFFIYLSKYKFGIIFIAMLAFIASYPLLILLRMYTKTYITFGYWLKNGYLHFLLTLLLVWVILYNL